MALALQTANRNTAAPTTAASIREPLAQSRRALAFVNREVMHPLPEGVATIGLGADCIAPTAEAIRAGRYPLTRPLYLYVARAALEELRVRSLARFTVEHYRELVSTVRTIVSAEQAAVERSAERLPPAPIPDG